MKKTIHISILLLFASMLSAQVQQNVALDSSVLEIIAQEIAKIRFKYQGPAVILSESGPQGPQGEKGDKGDTGNTGATGPTGPQGPAGADGADGVDGINGTNGVDGTDGVDGYNYLHTMTSEGSGANCSDGGYRVDHGLDTDRDNILDVSEILGTFYVCNGIDGTGADTQDLSTSKSGTTYTVNLTNSPSIAINVADNDNSSTNELQTLSQSGNDITLSNGGGTVTVASGGSDDQNLVIGSNASSPAANLYLKNEGQASGTNLQLSGANFTFTASTTNNTAQIIYDEQDPVFAGSAAADITEADITNWDNDANTTVASGITTSTSNFDGNLSSSNNTVQSALETLDDINLSPTTIAEEGTNPLQILGNENDGYTIDFAVADNNDGVSLVDGANLDVKLDFSELTNDDANFSGASDYILYQDQAGSSSFKKTNAQNILNAAKHTVIDNFTGNLGAVDASPTVQEVFEIIDDFNFADGTGTDSQDLSFNTSTGDISISGGDGTSISGADISIFTNDVGYITSTIAGQFTANALRTTHFYDKDGDGGTDGQVIVKTASGVNWQSAPGDGTGTDDQTFLEVLQSGRNITAANGLGSISWVNGNSFTIGSNSSMKVYQNGSNPLELYNSGSGDVHLYTNSPTSNGRILLDNSSDQIQMFGDVYHNGTSIHPSDRRLKKDITGIERALDRINATRPVSYSWKSENKDQKTHYGFIAQEVEQVIPSVVHTDDEGMKSVAYTELIAWNTKAIQELSEENKKLRAMIEYLANEIEKMKEK